VGVTLVDRGWLTGCRGAGVGAGFGLGFGAGAGTGAGSGAGSGAGVGVVGTGSSAAPAALTPCARPIPPDSASAKARTHVHIAAECVWPPIAATQPRMMDDKLIFPPAEERPRGGHCRPVLLLSPRFFQPPYTGLVSQKREKLIVDNRRARHEYHLLERVEAGLVLTGTEVKSLRDGRASLQQAYADVRNGEAWLVGAHISVYDQGNIANHDPDRDRKLLLHKKEVASLAGQVAQRGLTLVPTRLYFKNGRAKVELALARGKEQRDKRRDLAKREADRQIERALKTRR
jgi:SsrA-binding protein